MSPTGPHAIDEYHGPPESSSLEGRHAGGAPFMESRTLGQSTVQVGRCICSARDVLTALHEKGGLLQREQLEGSVCLVFQAQGHGMVMR